MNKRGRYWIFAFNKEYPSGGMNDFLFSFNTIDEFEDKSIKLSLDYTHYQILDTHTHFHYEGDFGTITKWICKNIGGEDYNKDGIM